MQDDEKLKDYFSQQNKTAISLKAFNGQIAVALELENQEETEFDNIKAIVEELNREPELKMNKIVSRVNGFIRKLRSSFLEQRSEEEEDNSKKRKETEKLWQRTAKIMGDPDHRLKKTVEPGQFSDFEQIEEFYYRKRIEQVILKVVFDCIFNLIESVHPMIIRARPIIKLPAAHDYESIAFPSVAPLKILKSANSEDNLVSDLIAADSENRNAR
ncbi:hypothetical protein L1887_57620 [Cichorium endivia]|nr:hypothetical protein L1887_57620 [Cichorium endivia]